LDIEDIKMNKVYKGLKILELVDIFDVSSETEFWTIPFYTEIGSKYIKNNKIMVFSISGSNDCKRWDTKKYINLINKITKEFCVVPCLVGGEDVIKDSYEIQFGCSYIVL